MQYNLEEWKAIQHALDTSCALVSFHIEFYELGTPLPFSLIEHLSLKKTFVNLSIAILSILDKYSGKSRGQVVYLLCAILHLVSV